MTRWPRGQRWIARVVLGFLVLLPFIIMAFIQLRHHQSFFPIPVQSHNLDVILLIGAIGLVGWGCLIVAAIFVGIAVIVTLSWLGESAFSAEPRTWKGVWRKVMS